MCTNGLRAWDLFSSGMCNGYSILCNLRSLELVDCSSNYMLLNGSLLHPIFVNGVHWPCLKL